jgi:hypothetical protein
MRADSAIRLLVLSTICNALSRSLVTASTRDPPYCSANLIAGVAADTAVSGVICAHMPADGAYPSDAEVASVRGGLRIESGR